MTSVSGRDFKSVSGYLLMRRVAVVRLLLSFANFAVILIDRSVPALGTEAATGLAILAACAFIIYASLAFLAISQKRATTEGYEIWTPFLDVVFAAVLIAATDGYLSPFHLWLAFAVVGSGVTGRTWQPFAVTAVALLAHCLIALIPEEVPLNVATFAVRTTYLFGFAAVVAAIAHSLTKTAETIERIEEFGRSLAHANTLSEIQEALTGVSRAVLSPDGLEVAIDDKVLTLIENSEGSTPTLEERPEGGSGPVILVRFSRRIPFTEGDHHIIRILSDRLAASIRRLDLSEQLVQAAAREERLRLADEVHDSYLQIMAGVRMHGEVAKTQLHNNPAEAEVNIDRIVEAAQEGTRKARAFVDGQYASHPKSGPDHIEAALRERWRGPLEVDIAQGVNFSEGQWKAIEVMAKEGVNNAVAHGRAAHLWFSIAKTDSGAVVELAADGEPLAEGATFGYGLTRLQKVLESNSGKLELVANQRGGTSLVVTFASDDTGSPS